MPHRLHLTPRTPDLPCPFLALFFSLALVTSLLTCCLFILFTARLPCKNANSMRAEVFLLFSAEPLAPKGAPGTL